LVVFEFENPALNTIVPLLAVLLIGFAAVRYLIYRQEEWVARCLLAAERDLNNLLSGGQSHTGRKEKVEERREWNKMAELPTVQINKEGYRTIAHDLVAANEKELAGKGATMGKASITAYLLRELYQGDVEAAQIKIFADTRNSDDKKPPYIAPGIYELVGFDKFDPDNGFPAGSGVEEWLLRRVVRGWRFPRDIRMTYTDATGNKAFRDPMDALAQLIQQNL
jgi:hypothetical protein